MSLILRLLVKGNITNPKKKKIILSLVTEACYFPTRVLILLTMVKTESVFILVCVSVPKTDGKYKNSLSPLKPSMRETKIQVLSIILMVIVLYVICSSQRPEVMLLIQQWSIPTNIKL